jgi:hypothetical protein
VRTRDRWRSARGAWGGRAPADDRRELGRMRALLRDVEQQPERGMVLAIEFVAKESLETVLRDGVAVSVQLSRRHDEARRYPRRLTRDVEQQPLEVRGLRRGLRREPAPMRVYWLPVYRLVCRSIRAQPVDRCRSPVGSQATPSSYRRTSQETAQHATHGSTPMPVLRCSGNTHSARSAETIELSVWRVA